MPVFTPNVEYQYPTVPTGGVFVPQIPSPAADGEQQSSSPDVTGLIKVGKNLVTNTGPSILPSGVANAVDDIGRSFGVGKVMELPGPSLPNVYGPAPAGVGTQGGLSTNFSAANVGAGLAGGFAANAVFGGGMGTNVGSTLGGIAGSFGGPVGSFIGSFLGGGIGSMFGKKKPSNRLQVGGINMATGEYDSEGAKLFSQSGKKFSEGNAKIRDAYSMAAADMVKFLRQNNAEQVGEFGNLVIRVGDRSGYDYFFETPTNSTETVDFRGSQRNAELMNKQDSERNIQSFGRDLDKFNQGLQSGILDKFKASPELAEQARQLFMQRVQELGGLPGQAQGMSKPLAMAKPMVAGKKTFKEFMLEPNQAQSKG